MNPADPMGLQARVEVQMLEAQQFQGATATSTNAQAPDEKKWQRRVPPLWQV